MVKKMYFMTCLQITLPAEITCPDRVSLTNLTAANSLKQTSSKVEIKYLDKLNWGTFTLLGSKMQSLMEKIWKYVGVVDRLWNPGPESVCQLLSSELGPPGVFPKLFIVKSNSWGQPWCTMLQAPRHHISHNLVHSFFHLRSWMCWTYLLDRAP